MFEIFAYPQVITICLLSMFLLPLVFYLASNQSSGRSAHSRNRKGQKSFRMSPANNRNKQSGLQSDGSKVNGASSKSAADDENLSGGGEGESNETRRDRDNRDDEPELREED